MVCPSLLVKVRTDVAPVEIDHNFSRAHRIVTSSILPIVESYAAHSRDVWEGSKVRQFPYSEIAF